MQGANSDNVNNTETSQAPGEYPGVHADYSTRQVVKDSTDSMQDSQKVSGFPPFLIYERERACK